MPKVLIIIPAYNEEKNIVNVINNIKQCNIPDIQIDYIIINDCSNDKTLEICKKNNFKYLNLPINLGIGGGVQTGYKYAFENDYDIAIQHDGDGQHDPIYFSAVISPIINKDSDIVIGSRFIEKQGFQSTELRRLGIGYLSCLIWICTGLKIKDVTSGYRAINKKYIKLFASQYAQDYPEPEAIMDAILNGARIIEVPVIMLERKEGTSSINALKSIYYMIKVSLTIIMHRLIVKKIKIN